MTVKADLVAPKPGQCDYRADQVIDYTRQRFEDEVHDVDLVLDLIAGQTQERSWTVLKDGGTMISSLARPSAEEARKHHARAETFVAHPDREELMEIGRLIDEGRVHPHVSAVFELKDAAEAQAVLEQRHAQGKVVLQMG